MLQHGAISEYPLIAVVLRIEPGSCVCQASILSLSNPTQEPSLSEQPQAGSFHKPLVSALMCALLKAQRGQLGNPSLSFPAEEYLLHKESLAFPREMDLLASKDFWWGFILHPSSRPREGTPQRSALINITLQLCNIWWRKKGTKVSVKPVMTWDGDLRDV